MNRWGSINTAGPMLCQRRTRWPSIETALSQRLMFTGRLCGHINCETLHGDRKQTWTLSQVLHHVC